MAFLILYLLIGFALKSYSVYKKPYTEYEMREEKDVIAFLWVMSVWFWPAFLLIYATDTWIKFLIEKGNKNV
jgi:hypothetical protein